MSNDDAPPPTSRVTPEPKLIVTGAGGGMGRHAVWQLLARGCHVVAVDRDEALLAEVAAAVPEAADRLHPVVADVTSLADVTRYTAVAGDRWGRLDGVFHIAGSEGAMPEFLDADIDEFERMIAINASSVWYGMKLAMPLLLANGGGSIVNTGSYVAYRGTYRTAAYGAAKHAVTGMTKGVSNEFATRNVRVNMVAPGSMDTRMIRTLWQNNFPDDPEAGKAKTLSRVPNGRLGDPAEVASVGVWLLLDAPTHITGQVIAVDGGRST